MPAARDFILRERLNEFFPGDLKDIGIIVQGGLYNGTLRALERLGMADLFGESRVPVLCLNVTYPLVPQEIRSFCADKKAVLIVEEGFPEYIEHMVSTDLRRGDVQTRLVRQGRAAAGRRIHPRSADARASRNSSSKRGPPVSTPLPSSDRLNKMTAHLPAVQHSLRDLPPRPPTFCTGCPERPVFSALKLMQAETGNRHISADIGCHCFGLFAPFSMGNSILGYGMSLASAAAVGPNLQKRPIAVMGDGGFWHNGLITGVTSNLFNKGDGLLIIFQNGYTSATGLQYMPSSKAQPVRRRPDRRYRADAPDHGREVAAQGPHLRRLQDDRHREGGAGQRRARAEGHHRRRRMPARAPAPRPRGRLRQARARRARGAHQVRRRRRDLHRRSFLHPAVGLPVADGEALARSAAHRSGRERDRIPASAAACAAKSRMPPCCARPSTRPRSCATPPGGTARCSASGAPSSAGSPAVRSRTRCPPAPFRLPRANRWPHDDAAAPGHHADRRAWRRRRRRAHQLDHGGGGRSRPAGAIDLDPRRRAAHRRHHLLHRNLSDAFARAWAAPRRCSRSHPASATSTCWCRPNSWKPGAVSPTASARPTARC